MIVVTLAGCWALVVAACTKRLLERLDRRPPTRPRRRADDRRPFGLESLGAWCRRSRAMAWADALDPSDDRPIGAVVVLGAGLALIEPALAAAVLIVGFVGVIRRARRRGRTTTADPLEVATVLDLLAIASDAGLSIDECIRALGGNVDPPFDTSAERAVEMIEAGGTTSEALATLFSPGGEHGERVVRSLASARRDGASLAGTLQSASGDLFSRGRREAEHRARKLPVRLLFPLVICVLPAFALLTVVPLLAGSVGSLPF